MAEYIEREAAIRSLTLHDCDSAGAKVAICDLPAADVCPVVHGRWNQAIYTEAPLYICSECYKPEYKRHKYCPNCGAKMDGDN